MYFINTMPEVQLHRGDTFSLDCTIYSGNNLDRKLYKIDEKDEIYFALLEPNQIWEDALVKKKYTSNFESKIDLLPNDTKCLLPGLYYYQIKLRKSENEVYTLCNRSKLYILE